jgi:F0F1-type ATP synthase assembly protein I
MLGLLFLGFAGGMFNVIRISGNHADTDRRG